MLCFFENLNIFTLELLNYVKIWSNILHSSFFILILTLNLITLWYLRNNFVTVGCFLITFDLCSQKPWIYPFLFFRWCCLMHLIMYGSSFHCFLYFLLRICKWFYLSKESDKLLPVQLSPPTDRHREYTYLIKHKSVQTPTVTKFYINRTSYYFFYTFKSKSHCFIDTTQFCNPGCLMLVELPIVISLQIWYMNAFQVTCICFLHLYVCS